MPLPGSPPLPIRTAARSSRRFGSISKHAEAVASAGLRLLRLLALMACCSASLSHALPAPRAPERGSWQITPAGQQARGLALLSGADGLAVTVQRGGKPGAAPRADAPRPSEYLYFQYVQAGRRSLSMRSLYVSVEYFDTAPGSPISLQYDSGPGDALQDRYRPAEDQAGGWAIGSRKWRTAIFLLERPRFEHRQNLGADFRLLGAALCVRAVRLHDTRPSEWDAQDRLAREEVKPLLRIGVGGELIVGGFDPARRADGRLQARALEHVAPALRALGVTSHECSVRWNLCEPEEGVYDWSVYDRFVAVYRRHGLRWVPFLIAGPAYSLPDWYYKKPGAQGYVCLEHNQETDVQSLWNPRLRAHIARFLQAFCRHYQDGGVLESILIGVTGNYGEAIYPASGLDWTADTHGPYHTHAGFWAGDPFARESFRRWLIRKYGGTDRLRDAWGTPASNINAVEPFLRRSAPNDRAWLDQIDWYTGSMTEWAAFWLRETRRHFPTGEIYLCTGGHGPPEHGTDFGAQCRAAASVRGGVRITNEASDYGTNFALTRRVVSAGHQYGAYFSFEPASGVTPEGIVARIYNATASGARGLHFYFDNLFRSEPARENFVRFGAQFKQRRPHLEIGVYYPQTDIALHGNSFLHLVPPLRDRFDFDLLSDGEIADGGLARVRALVLLSGNTAEAAVWLHIRRWVEAGGLLLYPDGMGRLRTVEGDETPHTELFGPGALHGQGRVLWFAGSGDSAAYRAFVIHELRRAGELSAEAKAVLAADGEEDGVYVTPLEGGELLWLNTTAASVRMRGRAGTVLMPHAIAITRPQ